MIKPLKNFRLIILNFNNPLTKKVFIIFTVLVFLFIVLNIVNGAMRLKEKNEVTPEATQKTFFSFNNHTTTVIIDAGHGGEDGGAVSPNEIFEKDINLKIALKLKEFLILNGFNVIMIREDDISIYDEKNRTLHQKKVSDINNRIDIANANKDAIYISIHQNNFTQLQSVSGSQVFYTKNNAQSKVLAKIMQDKFIKELSQKGNRQIKQVDKDIKLMNDINNVAVLIECGFLSNQQEETLLRDENYQSKIAFTIMNSLYEYLIQQTNK